MKISGFTMVRNGDKYYFPIKEAILSILPLVDEFIVALGNCDADDKTREKIISIGSDKIKIIDRIWDQEAFVNGKVFADETTFALSQCTGDWCFYLQADEVIHEKDLDLIQKACLQYLDKPDVEGFLFKYYHFWGDYEHHLPFHGWCKNEIRIVRNDKNIYSFKDAISFRKKENQKLQVVEIEARIYHYGWVRPPEIMQSKKKEQDAMHHGIAKTKADYQLRPNEFDFGALGALPVFKGTHPAVMKDFIKNLHWKHKLNYLKHQTLNRPLLKHERTKYKIISFLENLFNGGKDFFGYTNWKKIQ